MVMTVSWRKGVNLWSFACRHRGLLTEDFEPTWAILRGNDEGLPAHVGPDVHCGFNRFPEACSMRPKYSRASATAAAAPEKSLEIGDDRYCLGAGGRSILLNFLDQRKAINQSDPSTFARKTQCDGSSDALCGARDDRNFAGKTPPGNHRPCALLRCGRCRRRGGCNRSSRSPSSW